MTDGGHPVRPAEFPGLPAAKSRLVHLCRVHGHPSVAAELLTLFGRATCPHCASPVTAATALS